MNPFPSATGLTHDSCGVFEITQMRFQHTKMCTSNSFSIYSQTPTMRFHGNARGACRDICYLTSIPQDKKAIFIY
jgi:hypothetical protein